MAEYADREHFIPIRKGELIDLLCADRVLRPDACEQFRQFCALVSATYHHEFNQRLEQLKSAYAPFDPDSETPGLVELEPPQRQLHLDDLFRDLTWLLERANFKQLSKDHLRSARGAASSWGVNTDVDFKVFERLAVFVRGDTFQKRSRRRLWNFYRLEETEVPIFRRLVLLLKLRPHPRLSRTTDTRSVYLKIFKDMPKIDIDMLLPGARVRFTTLDRSRVGLPFLTGLAMALWNVVRNFTDDVLQAVFGHGGNPTMLLWGIATGGLGYGTKSYFAYQGTKQRYHLTLTQSLYYQNLDSNAGVLFRLLDEAEEQESREAILAYYFLWRHAGSQGWMTSELDDAIERYLESQTNLKVDFEIGDALDKLERLGIVEKRDDRYRAIPLQRALELLDWTWDNYFKYNKPRGMTG